MKESCLVCNMEYSQYVTKCDLCGFPTTAVSIVNGLLPKIRQMIRYTKEGEKNEWN